MNDKQPAQSTEMREKRLLLVEDERFVAMDEKRLLENSGFSVVVAHTGQEAVDVVRDDAAADLVLMDIDLGEGMTGPEAAEHILKVRDLPVVFLTAHAERDYLQKARGIANYGYILKGSSDFVLVEAINMALKLFESHLRLKKSEEEKALILNATVEMVALYDTDLRVIWANSAAGVSVGKTSEELVGMHCFEIWHIREDPCPGCPVIQALKTKRHQQAIQKTPDGRSWSIRGYPILDENGAVAALVEFGQDITEQVERETDLQNALREKSFLMDELNHRVKNNLAMVVALVRLKDAALGEGVDLSDIRNQINAILTVHDKLQKSGSITHIRLRDYLDDILRTVFSFSEIQPVHVDNEVEDIEIPTPAATTLGLIINELATNAMKHGFVSGEEARFSIGSNGTTRSHQLILTVSNSGRPFPEDVSLENPTTLGLRLISASITHRHGSIELDRAPHPRFTIHFPLE